MVPRMLSHKNLTAVGSKIVMFLLQLFALMLGLKITDQSEVKERFEVACLIIKYNANINARNKQGRVPLQCCSNATLRNAVRQFAEKQ